MSIGCLLAVQLQCGLLLAYTCRYGKYNNRPSDCSCNLLQVVAFIFNFFTELFSSSVQPAVHYTDPQFFTRNRPRCVVRSGMHLGVLEV
jgi:hypothetical protein